LFLVFVALIVIFFIYKINKYFDAKIRYDSIDCSDRAYMIYKQYDDQTTEHKDRDWSLRNAECVEVETDYQRGF